MFQYEEEAPKFDTRKYFSLFSGSPLDNDNNETPAFINLKSESVIHLATPQLAQWHRRKMESHFVKTIDGYVLTLHRIQNYLSSLNNRTVLLHHGLLGSSTDWILLGPIKSLPYILADAGYDVWITNARGNYYSRGHLTITVDFPEYWNFSWQEMGQYDLPAVIDYIRRIKNSTELIDFIGHSMGATALLVLLSTAPRYNDYLRLAILLAPLAFMSNVQGPLKELSSLPQEIIKTMGTEEFLSSRKVPSWLAHRYCRGLKTFCSNPLLFLSGDHQKKNWNLGFIARLLYHVPAGASINTILHYIQLINSSKFHKFNNSASEFPVKDITLPMVLFSSSEDWLATTPDVLKLYFSIHNPIDHYIIRDKNVSHTDFVWGSEASVLVFSKIVKYLKVELSRNMLKTNTIE
ncbi:Acidic lipase [Operophtera brumata]|uniref:Lipase n=1 Tax=Operophtera brumata TaxID=104452 RepID=A0A0L7K3U5_OPEBR|nr:Acidic lipase [Operophtera brumata]